MRCFGNLLFARVSCFHGAVFHTDFFMCYKGDVPNDRSWVEQSSLTGE